MCQRNEYKIPDHLKQDNIIKNKYLWIDPDENSSGMLSADRIAYYSDLVSLISPFNKDNLRPASYELVLGERYLLNGEYGYLSKKNPNLTIPNNSIVYITIHEFIVMPHYIAARFNLTIDLIYQGLLLGTGPQVDPGFKGQLSCPLHNISSQSVTIKYSRPVAKIDFIKTTKFGTSNIELLNNTKSEEILRMRTIKSGVHSIAGINNKRHILFKDKNCFRIPISDYVKNDDICSSLDNMESSINDFRKRINRYRIISGVIILGLVGIIVALFAIIYGFSGNFTGINNRIDNLMEINSTLDKEIFNLKNILKDKSEQLNSHSEQIIKPTNKVANTNN